MVKLSSVLLNPWDIPIALHILSTGLKVCAGEGMMIWVLNIDVAIAAIRNAFNPLTCTVELYDYQKVIRLRVFGPDNTAVLSIPSLSVRDVVDPSILRAELQQARALVETKGFRLSKSWTLPSWQTYIPRGNQST